MTTDHYASAMRGETGWGDWARAYHASRCAGVSAYVREDEDEGEDEDEDELENCSH